MEGGAAAAHRRLDRFLERVDHYPDERDRPDLDATSRLSTDLKFGTLSPRDLAEQVGTHTPGRSAFVRQLAWRDFYAHILHHYPATATAAMRPEYDRIAWRDDPDGLAAWKQGTTGYPIVDAGMRQLLGEGWMHNRVRMITASFLIKDLLVPWQAGEAWFWDTLVDADLASNAASWQWVAGSGADAAPYFRVFNPVLQGEKFDPEGAYVRRWLTEIAALPDSYLHKPWQAPEAVLREAGIELGADYPHPIVDHAAARTRALGAYDKIRKNAA